jgi:uncharacterized membrane protein
MMIFYHIFFDLNYFKLVLIDLKSIFMLVFLYTIGTTFLLLVGISLSINYSKMKQNYSEIDIRKKIILRGFKILMIGFLITIITWIYPKDGFIIFGVLHCIGLSIIISTFFLKYNITNLVFGTFMILIGIFLDSYYFNFNYFLWLGLKPIHFYTLDYFPLFPWIGVILIGIFFGQNLYSGKTRNFVIKCLSNYSIIKFLTFLGRHSLILYLIHQPIIIGFILLLKNFNFTV